MERKLILGIAGGLALVLGTLLPIISTDLTGERSLLDFDTTYGVMMLVIAAVAMLLAVLGRYNQLLIAVVPAAGFMIATYYKFYTARSEALALASNGDVASMDVFARMVISAGTSLETVWTGWLALLIGLVCLSIAAWPDERVRAPARGA